MELFWSAFLPDFPAFGVDTEDTVYLSVFSPDGGKCEENPDENTDSFYAVYKTGFDDITITFTDQKNGRWLEIENKA